MKTIIGGLRPEGRSFGKYSAPISPAVAQDLFSKLAVEPAAILDFYQPMATSMAWNWMMRPWLWRIAEKSARSEEVFCQAISLLNNPLICLFDVLEHINDESTALRAIRKKLNQGGKILITVPAYMFLWSAHDVAHQHKRRYRKGQVLRLVQKAGFKVSYSTYFNSILFPVIAATRIMNNIFGRESDTDVKMPSKIINNLLMKIFAGERFFMPGLSLPFGVSILVIVEKMEQ